MRMISVSGYFNHVLKSIIEPVADHSGMLCK